MPTVFTMIVDGDLPGHFVWRDERCVAFLSINPMAEGHTLVVPRDEVDHFDDLDPATWTHCAGVAQAIAKAQKAAFGGQRIGLVVAGYEVPHVHIHVFPTDTMADFDWANAAAEVDHDHLADLAGRLRSALRSAGHDHAAD